jgi:hypothetical protein
MKDKIRKAFELCLKINDGNKAQAFFYMFPHSCHVDINLCIPYWDSKGHNKEKNLSFYYDGSLEKNYNYENIIKELEEYL